MSRFYIGLVSEYMRTAKGFHVALDTGRRALLSLEAPIPDKYLSGDFSLDIFERNLGIALHVEASGLVTWYPAQICAVLLGASYRSGGRMLGMENWRPDAALPFEAMGEGAAVFQDGTISVGLAGGTAAPYYIYQDMPDYDGAGALLKEAVKRITVSDADRVFTSKSADRGIIKELEGKNGVTVTLARIDFAYTEGRKILYVQKTECPDKEMTSGG